jgi:hypothetical protein
MPEDPAENYPTPVMEELPPEKRNVTILIDAADQHHYSNVASVTISPWDIRLNFADVDVSDETHRHKAHHGIVMPVEHAAGLVFLLTNQLKAFEAQFGKIRHPKWRKMMDGRAQEGAPSSPNEPISERTSS